LNTNIDLHIGTRLRELRLGSGRSFTMIAMYLGRAPIEIAALELGQQRLRASDLFALCDLFRVRPKAFFGAPVGGVTENLHACIGQTSH
jgi:transcriptional regulator with XRE-family HTH domain